ncbi:MAG TPA: SRPBCC family protein [Actinomycetota bacterium]|nr:SRPBCC family protein [Actinomycetota bacterium]
MSVVRASEIIDASPETVWQIISDPRNLPRWNQHIKKVTGVPEDGLKPGSRYTTSLRVVGVPFDVHAEVLRIDPPRYAEIRLTGPLEALVRTWVRPAGKARSRLDHEVTYRVKRIGPAGRIIDQGLRVMGAGTLLRRGTRAQKRQVERG